MNRIRVAARSLLLASMVSVIPIVAATPATAQTVQALNIPAGSLGSAVTRLGRGAQVVIAYDPSLLRGKRTSGLRGTYQVTQALDILLAGSGIRAISDGKGGFRLNPATLPSTPFSSSMGATAGKAGLMIGSTPVSAQEAQTADEGAAPADIVVTGSAYRGDVAAGGARIDAEVKDLPLSISVVTEALIEDRQIRNLRDLAENVAGVRSRASGTGAFAIDFSIRGFQGGSIAMNGYRVDNFSAGFDPQNVERVEFLKGPASVLYGASGALSGLTNIVTKTPQSDNFLTIDATGGAPLYGRFGADGNVQVTDTLDARVNVALTHEKQLNAFRDVNEQFASPTLRWRPTDNLMFLVEGTYFHVDQPTRGVANYPADVRFTQLPRDFKIGERWDQSDNTGWGLRAEATWEIAKGLTIRQGYNLQSYRDKHFDIRLEGLIEPDIVERSASRGDEKGRYEVSQSEIRWNFGFLGMSHKALAGYEYSKASFGGFCCDATMISPLDLNNPVYDDPKPDLGLTELFDNTILAKAFYIQDFIEVGQFKVLAGIRRDNTTLTSGWCNTATPGCSEGDPVARNLGSAKVKAWTPRFGVVWQPTDRTTLFVSYAKSFNPNPLLDRNNRLLPPERGTQYEAGVRQELLDPGQLLLSLSAFTLTRQNIADCDPLFINCDRFAAIGEQRVRGIEAELSGKPVSWIDIIANYTYLRGRVTKSDEATSGVPVGSKLPEATPHSASIFTKIGLDPIGAEDVAISAGVYYVSNRPGRDYFGSFVSGPFARSFTVLPNSVRVDLGAFWKLSDALRLQANLTNVFDKKVYEPVNYGFNINQRRRFTLGATATF